MSRYRGGMEPDEIARVAEVAGVEAVGLTRTIEQKGPVDSVRLVRTSAALYSVVVRYEDGTTRESRRMDRSTAERVARWVARRKGVEA